MDSQPHHKKLNRYIHVAKAVEGLFSPHVEVVIHDAIGHQIYAIFNNISNRESAEPSNYNEHEHPDSAHVVSNTYLKHNWNGHKMKSVSTKLMDEDEHLIGIMSFHFDISPFDEFQQTINNMMRFGQKSEIQTDQNLHEFLKKNYNFESTHIEQFQKLLEQVSPNRPGKVLNKGMLFEDDWEQRINNYILQYIEENHNSTTAVLTKQEKKDIIDHLYHDGAFKGKNAAAYVANILGISRATVYRYLAEKGYKH
ncbi:MAG: helix-turn-helix domain-containing protein [Gammaproteobacteria bacterium]|nr:helix-turn-helix domain-containing protein [Gammaproteobacteria bacterium]